MSRWWKRGAALAAMMAFAVTGAVLTAGPAAASADGCNGDICIEVNGDNHDTNWAKVTYRGSTPETFTFGLRTEAGMYWSPPIQSHDGTSFTWTKDRALFPVGQVCGTLRYVNSVHGPPGYPCVTIKYWS